MNIEQNALLTALFELIEQLKKPHLSVDNELWSSADIAVYLKLSLDTVERYVLTRVEFPKPLQPCLTGKRAAKRWFAGEIIGWAKQNRGNIPKLRARNRQSKREAISDAVGL